MSKNECIDALNLYDPTHVWSGTYPMTVNKSDKKIMKYMNKIRKQVSKNINHNLEIEWCEIVRWPIGSSKKPHLDSQSDKTKLVSITYLNQSYTGGNTYIVDGMVCTPKIGRTLCFDGHFYVHGVTPIDWNDRYTMSIWYK